MDNPQYYQPLSAALHAPLVSTSHSSPRQPYAPYASHQHPPVTNGASSSHREEEEEEEDDDDDVVEEELQHHDVDHPHRSASSHSSPRINAAHSQSSSASAVATSNSANYRQTVSHHQDHNQSNHNDDSTEKRKPGRPRGSRNRKPRVSSGSATKAPANTQHPGFYQYPPAPGTNISQSNQQFYEFQWRALNLCSEFYNAAEELVKAASPMVIAQCYQMGPATKIDPLMMIADAKRVCDNLLANPSQLVGQPVPTPTYPTYSSMPPPPPPGIPPPGPAPAAGTVITNPQTFVMPLNSSSMPPSSQPYYPAMYPPAGSRYPPPYYYPPPQGPTPYYPPPPHSAPAATPASLPPPTQPQPPPAPPPAPVPAPVTTPAPTPASLPPPAPQASPPAPPPSIPANTGTISTFNAATGNTAPGGHQGTWSEEETERLKMLAEQSREMGGPQNKGEIEWDWVIKEWGNSRTRHQILLKATSLGLKESTTRGTKRRREAEPPNQEQAPPPPPQPQPQQPEQSAAATNAFSPTRSPMNSAPTSMDASPAMQPKRPPSSSLAPPPRSTSSNTASTMPWPLPTMASASSILPTTTGANSKPANNASDAPRGSYTTADRNSTFYRPRPTQTTPYAAAATQRPSPATTHNYMFRPDGPA